MINDVELLAIGAGPANLALAVALEETNPNLARASLFVEKEPNTRWHRHMLLPGTQSQVSFVKDLVSLRNPRSRYSFLNFLFEHGRLNDFVNLSTFTPYREEISRYLDWVSRTLEHVKVEYGRACVELQPMFERQRVTRWAARFDDGSTVVASRVVVGAGRPANIPGVFKHLPKDSVVHTSAFLQNLNRFDPNRDRELVVIGGAQSAAEVFRDLHERFPEARLHLVMRSAGLVGYEGSKFVNELFYPEFVSEFYDCQPEQRQSILDEMHRTNYAGVTPGLLEELYRNEYMQRLTGERRSEIHTMVEIVGVTMEGRRVVLRLRDKRNDKTRTLHADKVILGTGYQPGPPKLVQDLLRTLGIEYAKVNRNYRLELPSHVHASVHVQGVNEETHGISDSLLSVLAHRSREITNDLMNSGRAIANTTQLAQV